MAWRWGVIAAWHGALWLAYKDVQPLVWLPLAFGLTTAAVTLAIAEIRAWPGSPAYFGLLSVATSFFWIRSMEGAWPWPAFGVLVAQVGWLWFDRKHLQGHRAPLLWAVAFCAGVGFLSGGKGSPLWMIDFFRHQLGMSDTQAHDWVLISRKVFHFSFYGCYAVVWRAALRSFGLRNRQGWWALTLVLFLACFDEGRQHFSPDRTGSAWDVLLDLAGAVTLFAISELLTRRSEPV